MKTSNFNPAPFHKVDMSKHRNRHHAEEFLQMVINYCSAQLEVVAKEKLCYRPDCDITSTIDLVEELVGIIETCKISIETSHCNGFIPAWVLVDMLKFECLQSKKNTTVMRYIISLIKDCK